MADSLRNEYEGWDIQQPPERPDRRRTEMLNSTDQVRAYMNQIGKTELLSAEEEVDLAKRIEAGLYASNLLIALDDPKAVPEIPESFSLGRPGGITPEFRHNLRIVSRDGQQAKSHMLEANLRLVVSIAKRYTGSTKLTFLELIQEGNLGLIRGVEKFDYTKGNKFSTYGTWWIRQAITRAMADQGRIIRLPVHLAEKVNTVKRKQRELTLVLEREPNSQEILEAMDDENMTVARVEELLSYGRNDAMSYNQRVSDDGTDGDELADFIEDIDAVDPAEAAERSRMVDELHEYLDATLNRREIDIISQRFGLGGDSPSTLEDLGKKYRLSRERIRQIQRGAMAKLLADAPEKLRHYITAIQV